MRLKEKVIPISALQDNYIWLFFDEATKKATVVDPGEAKPVMEALQHYGLQLENILITHHHWDHSNGVKELNSQRSLKVYGSYRSTLPFITHHVKEGDTIQCTGQTLQILEIPGHTLDHTAFFNSDVLFCGDTLFSFGCGKIFEGTPEQMYHSLKKLSALSPDTQVFCGHEYTLSNLYFAKKVEPHHAALLEKIKQIEKLNRENIPTLPSTIQIENTLNPFLRCEQTSIIQAVERFAGHQLKSPVEVFAMLRKWKNEAPTI